MHRARGGACSPVHPNIVSEKWGRNDANDHVAVEVHRVDRVFGLSGVARTRDSDRADLIAIMREERSPIAPATPYYGTWWKKLSP